MKNQKGITLIALVITIIVLLILAGVSIAMLTGDNGLLGKAKTSGAENAIAEAKEAVGMAVNQLTADYFDQKYVKNNISNEDASLTQYQYVAKYLGENESPVTGKALIDTKYFIDDDTKTNSNVYTITLKEKDPSDETKQVVGTYYGVAATGHDVGSMSWSYPATSGS